MNDTFKDFLLISANIGSTFEFPEILFPSWTENVFDVIKKTQPLFIGIHCQEVGGKNYEESMQYVDNFMKIILTCEDLAGYDKARIYLDEDFTTEERFTALGSLYFIHESVPQVEHWDFQANSFCPVEGREVFSANIEHVAQKFKQKYPLAFFPEKKWSRKGFMHTKWRIFDQVIDLVNIHLFHDICNLTPIIKDPQTYAIKRREALEYTVKKVTNNFTSNTPLFIFGDFNFRLNCSRLLKELVEPKASIENIYKKSQGKSEEVCKIVYRSNNATAAADGNNNDNEVISTTANRMHNGEHMSNKVDVDKSTTKILEVGRRHFDFIDSILPFFNEMEKFRDYDEEPNGVKDILRELPIIFPPSYPFSEEDKCSTSYMRTRCPSWCDRILLNDAAFNLLDVDRTDYKMIGMNASMGDHKPINLSFSIKCGSPNDVEITNNHDTITNNSTGKLSTDACINVYNNNNADIDDVAELSKLKYIYGADTVVAHNVLTNSDTVCMPNIDSATKNVTKNQNDKEMKNQFMEAMRNIRQMNASNRRRMFHSTINPSPSKQHRFSIVDSINGLRASYQPEEKSKHEWNIFDNARFDQEQMLDLKFRSQHRPFGSLDGLSSTVPLSTTTTTTSPQRLFADTIRQVAKVESVISALRLHRSRKISESSTEDDDDGDADSQLAKGAIKIVETKSLNNSTKQVDKNKSNINNNSVNLTNETSAQLNNPTTNNTDNKTSFFKRLTSTKSNSFPANSGGRIKCCLIS